MASCLEAQGAHSAGPGPPARSEGSCKHESNNHALASCIVTLTLGILGSSVLPVPSAFVSTGVLLGLCVCGLVAWANSYTTNVMLQAARSTGKDSYEEIALLLGGKRLQRWTQFSLVLLLFGTLCGDLALLADAGRKTLNKLFGDTAPAMLTDDGGRGILLLITTVFILPMCMLRHIRSIETAATAGIVLVIALVVIIVRAAFLNDFVGLTTGDVPVLLPSTDSLSCLPGAFSVLGFAFYVQPMVMPLLHEMPTGDTGVRLTMRACNFTILGIAFFTYSVLGVFGAAAFGSGVRGDIMMNHVLANHDAAGILNACVLLYLATALIPINFTLRRSLEAMIAGPDAPPCNTRFVAVTVGSLASSLLIAMLFPTYAEKMFELTGATAVCLVCYVLPIIFHFKLQKREQEADQDGQQPAVEEGDGAADTPLLTQRPAAPRWRPAVLPLTVVVVGVIISALALYEAVMDAMGQGSSCVDNS